MKLLYIEDEMKRNKWHYEAFCEEYGESVTWCCNIKDSMQVLKENEKIEIIITDIMIPATEEECKLLEIEFLSINAGLHLIKYAKRLHPDAIIVVLTGRVDVSFAEVKASGGHYLFTKPIRAKEVISKLKKKMA